MVVGKGEEEVDEGLERSPVLTLTVPINKRKMGSADFDNQRFDDGRINRGIVDLWVKYRINQLGFQKRGLSGNWGIKERKREKG